MFNITLTPQKKNKNMFTKIDFMLNEKMTTENLSKVPQNENIISGKYAELSS